MTSSRRLNNIDQLIRVVANQEVALEHDVAVFESERISTEGARRERMAQLPWQLGY